MVRAFHNQLRDNLLVDHKHTKNIPHGDSELHDLLSTDYTDYADSNRATQLKRKIMSDSSSTHSVDDALSLARPRAFDTILYGGLVVGILDGLFALVFYGLILGVPPVRIFQSIASGLLGRASFEGGIPTLLLGILLHFVVASCLTAVYYLVSLKAPLLIHRPVFCGLIYGLLSYLGMNYVVIPLSAIGSRPFSLRVFLPAFVGHALFVGLPIGLITQRSAKANKSGVRRQTSG